jgi:hypothetical protein
LFTGRNWRLSVHLRAGAVVRTVTLDFKLRRTLELQLRQLTNHPKSDRMKLFEFTNEFGELLAFRASAFESFAITPLSDTRGFAPHRPM